MATRPTTFRRKALGRGKLASFRKKLGVLKGLAAMRDPKTIEDLTDEELSRWFKRRSSRIGYDTGTLVETLTTYRHPRKSIVVRGRTVELVVDHPGAHWWLRRGNIEKVMPEPDMQAVLKKVFRTYIKRYGIRGAGR